MLTPRAIRNWYLLHKWSSLVCTAFLLLICLTGLPLVFHHEIDELSGAATLPPLDAATPVASIDQVVQAARAQRPGEVIQYLYWEPDEPRKVGVSLAATATATEGVHALTFDGATASLLQAEQADEGVMYVLLKLHTDLFAGLPGKLFLGLMGGLFLAAVVSGVVLYAPFMRKLGFGTVRREKSARLKWLDLHNLLGVVTVAWVVVVGTTGVINTWADLVIKLWQFDQLSAMVAPYRDKPALREAQFGSLQTAIAAAQRTAPHMQPSFVAFPGSVFSSQHHYAVFLRGTTPLTARLLKPALIDAQTGQLTDTRELPWYVTAVLVSQPLHFGDYGGLPMKIIWALLDLLTIVVLLSGLYLWWPRRQRPLDQRVAEVMAGGEPQVPLAALAALAAPTGSSGAAGANGAVGAAGETGAAALAEAAGAGSGAGGDAGVGAGIGVGAGAGMGAGAGTPLAAGSAGTRIGGGVSSSPGASGCPAR